MLMIDSNNKKNYLFTMTSGLGATLIAMVISFMSIPIGLNYWKTEKYGIIRYSA